MKNISSFRFLTAILAMLVVFGATEATAQRKKPVIRKKTTVIYYYDYDSGDLVALETLLKFGIKPTDLNKVVGKKIVEQIVAGAKTVQGNPLIYIIIPIITLIIGIVLGHYLMPNTIVETVGSP